MEKKRNYPDFKKLKKITVSDLNTTENILNRIREKITALDSLFIELKKQYKADKKNIFKSAFGMVRQYIYVVQDWFFYRKIERNYDDKFRKYSDFFKTRGFCLSDLNQNKDLLSRLDNKMNALNILFDEQGRKKSERQLNAESGVSNE